MAALGGTVSVLRSGTLVKVGEHWREQSAARSPGGLGANGIELLQGFATPSWRPLGSTVLGRILGGGGAAGSRRTGAVSGTSTSTLTSTGKRVKLRITASCR